MGAGSSDDRPAGGGFQVNRQSVYYAAGHLSQLTGTVRALADEAASACSAAASACPGWQLAAASSAAGGRWQHEITARADAVAAAADKLDSSAARYEMVETTLVQQVSAPGLPGH